MKNEQIIMEERIKLLKEGKIKGKGNKIINPLDSYEMIEEPEEIHTKGKWEKEGFKVKEGEKAITKIKIWKTYKRKDSQGVMKVETDFYTKEQTERREKC